MVSKSARGVEVRKKMKKAFITGITGQDGSYLAEFLLSIGYEVHGLVRRNSSFNTDRIDHLTSGKFQKSIHLHHGDVTDPLRTMSILKKEKPDEIYNLAAQSHVRVSFDLPIATADSVAIGAATLLEIVRQTSPESSFYQASSSEMFGASPSPQSEDTVFQPQSPYATSKTFAYWMSRNYRDAYGMSISNGILFNHESPRRGGTFVTRKITRGVAAIKQGLQKELRLGNLNSKRDWGYAAEYVIPMWLMTSKRISDDFVIGTGKSQTVESFLENSFSQVGLNWRKYVVFDERYLRPNEVSDLCADTTKADLHLNWRSSFDTERLTSLMVDFDMRALAEPGHTLDVVPADVWKDYTS